MDRKRQAFLLALPVSLVLLVFFIAPMVYILMKTIAENGFSGFVEFFTDTFYLDILWTTVRVSLISTAVSLLLGYPTAYFMARTKSRLKKVMIIILLFPFLVSAVVRSYGWMVLLGTKGLINQLLLALSAHHKLPENRFELTGIYLEALLAREYREKRDLNAAPGKLELFLMKLALEDPTEQGHNLLRAMKLCAEIMQEYGVHIQSDVCINLAVQLGILQLTDGYVDFVLDDYRSYYLSKALDADI